jgi:hemolysin III
MVRTKLADRALPDYTHGEEIFNMVSHIVGGGMGVVVTALCVVFAAIHGNVYGVVSGAIFGGTMIVLYTMSSIYHGLSPEKLAKKVFQVIDHCSVYLLIAGTYTPFTLCIIREYNSALGWSVFGIIWGLAAVGIALNSVDLKMFRVISMILYLGMGWCIIFTCKAIIAETGMTGFWLLLGGGIAYTVGSILYGLGRNHRYMHSVFHLFVILGSLLHFLCILIYAM